jgi:hypothetical protein
MTELKIPLALPSNIRQGCETIVHSTMVAKLADPYGTPLKC